MGCPFGTGKPKVQTKAARCVSAKKHGRIDHEIQASADDDEHKGRRRKKERKKTCKQQLRDSYTGLRFAMSFLGGEVLTGGLDAFGGRAKF